MLPSSLAPFRGRGTGAKRQGEGGESLKRNVENRTHAKALRRAMTPPEEKLWSHLRAGRLRGIKFVSQMVFGPDYIADFAAREHRLIIELDGDSHTDEGHDARRDAHMAAKGWTVLRVGNNDVMTNVEGVCRAILNALGKDFE